MRLRLMSLIAALGLCLAQAGCAETERTLQITDIRIFRDTPAWELATAVKNQNVTRIRQIIGREPELLNYQDPHYGATLLLWAVGTERYRASETLLQLGADPEIASTYDGETPLFVASGFSWVDRAAKKDPKYVNLLLRYGADPNNVSFVGHSVPGVGNVVEPGTSPLMNTIGAGIEKTRALVDAGADINYKTASGRTAARTALVLALPEYAHYLIVERRAKVSDPYYPRADFPSSAQDPSVLHPVDLLRNWIFPLGSREYQLKLEIVAEFARQGVNYWDTEIPERRLDQIQKLYPETWEQYRLKY